ncbi:succinylglutamate desuccinylase/aspartoacylase family protein [Aestuariispira ectoiniformans]|uniref:succinylglutamate desuccinylase/aspartoacylase family protein n=1 Tax=Aestuariispira ectoiniformans TaxID=2775080 RepID=UPI00223BE650|nr:succinylglutamate desuccinylase/aspartoacylase family protein [Aestuariispira ectoiniformans]
MARQTDRIDLASSAPGTNRHLLVHCYGKPGSGPKAYLQAALHADEWPGIMAVHHLLPLLDAADAKGLIKGEIVVVPYANPIGMDQRIGDHVPGRYAFDGSGNYNRNWADLVGGAAPRIKGRLIGDAAQDVETVRAAFREVVASQDARSEVAQLRKVLMGLSCDADYVLDLHCDGEATMHIYANDRHRDIATELCLDMDSPVLLIETTAGGGPFDEANSSPWWRLGDELDEAKDLPHACFATTVEFRGRQDVSDDFGAKDAAGLYSFLCRRGVIDDVVKPQRDETFTAFLHETDVMHAPKAGFVSYALEVGTQVKAGDLIATIIDPVAADPAEARTELRARTDGIFFARVDTRLAAPGVTIAKVAGKTPLAHRKEGALLEA